MIILVVDTQKKIYTEELYNFEQVTETIERLIATARENGVEVVYVCHDDGENSGCTYGDEGFEIYERFKPNQKEKLFIKKVNSAFNCQTGLLEYLKSLEEKEVMIVGMQTDLCIDATIKSGFDNGIHMIIPKSANTTKDNRFIPKEILHEYFNESIWPIRYGHVVTEEDAVRILERND